MAIAEICNAEWIGGELCVFEVFKEPEIMREEDTEQFCGRQFLFFLDVD